MKKIALSTVLAVSLATTSLAGGLDDPIVMPEVVIEQAAASSEGNLVPFLLLGLLLAAALQSDSGGGGGVVVSDARLKTDITPLGETANGLPLYSYRYVGLPTVYEGVMAQDVLTHRPDAIVDLPFGYMAVDYDALGLALRPTN